jgi:hypothetical protein
MIYICGDSFAVPDIDHGPCWVDLLKEKIDTTTLARVCASNLLIAQQVDYAIAQQADAIIVLFTSSTRSQTRVNNLVVPYSIHSLDSTTPFSQKQLDILITHTAEFFDLELAIYENQLIIESILHRLSHSGIPFLFDQGGFEHTSYGGQKQYFQNFDQWRSQINLWDYAPKRTYRPYYHIKDLAIHQRTANYYHEHFKQA